MIYKILEKENISAENVKKSTSGFTNQVYFADDFVVKFTNEEKTKKQLEKETLIYKNLNLPNIPKYISSGEIDNCKYLIISKVEGKALYSIWHTLDRETQIKIIKKLTNIIKEFHKLSAEFLPEEFKFNNWKEYITNQLTDKSHKLKEMGYKTNKLDEFINNQIEALFKENKFGLVYNDAHFDNFLFDGEELFLIDFDRVIYAPLDYEMLIFKTMCDIPDKFASEEDYLNCKMEDYDFIYPLFKNDYPELFDEKTEEKIKVYQFNYLMEQAIGIKDKEWIEKLLNQFGFRD